MKELKKQLLSGVVEKLMVIPWVPAVFSFFSTTIVILLLLVLGNGLLRPNEAVSYRALLLGPLLSMFFGVLVGAFVKMQADRKLKDKLKKMGLL